MNRIIVLWLNTACPRFHYIIYCHKFYLFSHRRCEQWTYENPRTCQWGHFEYNGDENKRKISQTQIQQQISLEFQNNETERSFMDTRNTGRTKATRNITVLRQKLDVRSGGEPGITRVQSAMAYLNASLLTFWHWFIQALPINPELILLA